MAYDSIVSSKMYFTCFALFGPEALDKIVIPDGYVDYSMMAHGLKIHISDFIKRG
jgi:hypothetical protein